MLAREPVEASRNKKKDKKFLLEPSFSQNILSMSNPLLSSSLPSTFSASSNKQIIKRFQCLEIGKTIQDLKANHHNSKFVLETLTEICDLCCDEDFQGYFISFGGVQVLMNLLEEYSSCGCSSSSFAKAGQSDKSISQRELVVEICGVIANVTWAVNAQVEFFQRHGIDKCIDLMMNQYPDEEDVLIQLCGILMNCTQDEYPPISRYFSSEKDGIKIVFQLIDKFEKRKSYKLVSVLVSILWNLVYNNKENQRMVYKTDGVSILLKILQDQLLNPCPNLDLLTMIFGCLKNLALNRFISRKNVDGILSLCEQTPFAEVRAELQDLLKFFRVQQRQIPKLKLVSDSELYV